jgi:hypothetical protein
VKLVHIGTGAGSTGRSTADDELAAAPADEATEPSRLRRWWTLWSSQVVVWTWLVGFAAVRAGTPTEFDPYWQIRAGIENLTGTPLVRPDTWSWAPVGGNWYPSSPAWNVLLGLSWLGAGSWGLFLLTFVTLLTYFVLTYALARRLGARPLGALAGLMVVFLLGYPMFSARATVAVQVLILLGLYVPLRWRGNLVRRPTWVSAAVLFGAGFALSMTGVWVHLSFMAVAAAMAVAWAVYWLFSDWPGWRVRLSDRRRWAAAVAGCLGLGLGVLTTPYGVAGVLSHSAATAAVGKRFILEWVSPFYVGAGPWWVFVALSMIVILTALVVWLVQRIRHGNIDEVFAAAAMVMAVGLPFGIAGMSTLRFGEVATLTLAPVLGMGITVLVRRVQRWGARLPQTLAGTLYRWTHTKDWRNVLGLTVLLLSPMFVVMGPMAHASPPGQKTVESLPHGCNLFAPIVLAGTAILIRPDVLVWYDGRADYFGEKRLEDADAFFAGVAPTSAPVGATCVVLPGPDSAGRWSVATARLDADPSWHRTQSYDGNDVWILN